MYKTVQGDTWDLISWRNYGSEFYVDVLMKANPNLMDYVIFPSGIQVIIPVIKEKPNPENLPPWKRSS